MATYKVLSKFSTRTLLQHLVTRGVFGYDQGWCSECCSLDLDYESSYSPGCADENCNHDYGGDDPISLCRKCQDKYEPCPDCEDDEKRYCEKARSKCDKCDEWICRQHADTHECEN